MTKKMTWRALTGFVALAILLSLFSTTASATSSGVVSFTILHTNDFHGQLEEVQSTSPADGSSSNPGMARVATIVNNVRTAVGADNVLLVDGGDEMQGSLLSNLQKGVPTIDVFNGMGYDAATFGNHEFDWGQTVLGDRTTQATYPYLTANIVQNDTGDCNTAGWTPPTFADNAYQVVTIGTPPSDVQVAFIGVTTAETPTITIASATAGLCFKDPAQSISHYYPAMIAAGADVIVVLSHLGYPDGGYGYGIPVYGDQTLAQRLIDAGTPVHLIIGGHSHTNLSSATTVGSTKVVQAHYNGRKVGRADITVDTTTGSVAVTWTRLTVCSQYNTTCTTTPEDPAIKAIITAAASDPAYVALINTPIGWTNVPIVRNYDGDSLMGYFIDDALYNDLNNDGTTANDVDMFFNNAGGLRADITCGTYPCLINYGMMFNVLPFGNQTIVGDMRGDKILELLHQSATLFKGAIQPSGIRFSFFRYSDANPGPQPYAWGAYDITVWDKATSTWVPLDLTKTYRVGTNEFLAPAGQDGYVPFKYMTNISYWGDMLDGVNRWVSATYYDDTHAYNGALDGRITRDGDGDNDYEAGEIVPLTVLHHNDSHGNLDKTTYIGYTQLATLIKQERLHNPDRTLLVSSGDNIQGDAMSYYFKTAPTGFAADGTPIADSGMHIQPIIKMFNAMGYDAMTLGNHEFNYGKDVFVSILSQATFPILQANVTDDGSYGLDRKSTRLNSSHDV
jgi:2',3'-cyclic-nucleotide 2'-phosphodiesterase/3'-nucleotidase